MIFVRSITEHICVLGLIQISGHGFASCYHQLAGCYKFLIIQRTFFPFLHLSQQFTYSFWQNGGVHVASEILSAVYYLLQTVRKILSTR